MLSDDRGNCLYRCFLWEYGYALKSQFTYKKIQHVSWAVLSIFGMLLLGTVWAQDYSPTYLNEIQKKYGEYAKRRLVAWEKLKNDLKNADERKKLEEVNTFVNLLEYRSDLEHWGTENFWATPLEMIVSGAGDCKSYTITKYFTLLDLGVPDDKLLITYVKALDFNQAQAHMVLTYYATPNSIPLVLDNINKEILPADQRKDLIPIYAFNGKGLWQAKQLGVGNKIGTAQDLKKWVDLEDRMKSGTIRTFY